MDLDRESLYENLTEKNFVQFYNSFNSVSELIEFFKSRKRAEVKSFLIKSENDSGQWFGTLCSIFCL